MNLGMQKTDALATSPGSPPLMDDASLETVSLETVSPERGLDLALDDETVIARVLQGETPLFEVLMRRYNQRLFRAARAILRDDDEAEDALQEAYLQAYAHLAEFEGRARLSTWLTRIVVHEAYRKIRKRRPTRGLAVGDEPVAAMTPEHELCGRELASTVAQAIDELPEAFRLVFMLRVIERLDVSETAACLALPEATVKTRLHRARKLLSVEIADHVDAVHRFLGHRCNRVVEMVLARLV